MVKRETLQFVNQHQALKTEPTKINKQQSKSSSSSVERLVQFRYIGDKTVLKVSGESISNQINSPNMEATSKSQTYHFLKWKQKNRGVGWKVCPKFTFPLVCPTVSLE